MNNNNQISSDNNTHRSAVHVIRTEYLITKPRNFSILYLQQNHPKANQPLCLPFTLTLVILSVETVPVFARRTCQYSLNLDEVRRGVFTTAGHDETVEDIHIMFCFKRLWSALMGEGRES